jgi:predicted HTH transcriptional regulator
VAATVAGQTAEVEDKSGHVRGVRHPLDLEERLSNSISKLVIPRLVPELEILPWRRTQVLAVQVYPCPSCPHYLKHEGLEGCVYVRVGRAQIGSFPVREIDAGSQEPKRRHFRAD